MIRNILLLPFLCLAIAAQAQYSEPFSVASKGYKISCVDDFTAVNWSLSAWSSPTCAAGDNRDASDYFNTTAAGKLECIDLDQEVFWESPLINTTAANPVSIKMDLTWAEFDTDVAANDCSTDYIKVEYSVNGGAYVMIPNVAGGNACATVAYPFQNPGSQFSGSISINHGGVAGGGTLKIRIKVKTNANAELVTIDNVAVPEAGVNVGCAAPTLSTVVTPVGCSNPNSGAIDLTVSGGTPPYTYSWTGGATTQDISGKPTGTYTVTVTDAASCSATISATIGNAPTLTLTTQVLDASCSGNLDGEVSLDVSGGVPGYTYDWSNDGPENPDNDPQDLVGLSPGTYTVTVTDASGCTATKSATVGVLPSGAYNEQFNIANKGYLPNYADDFAGVNWTMGSWAPAPPAPFGREVNDYFRTSGGALVGIDFDQEICWTSPLIDLNGGTQFSVFLSWTLFDQEDYINVNYSIDGGAFVQVANVVGGGTGTIDYPPPALDQSGSVTVTKTGLSGGTIQIQVCGNFNSESMTVDNVNIPGSNNYCPAPEPSLTGTNVSCNGGSNGTITTTVTNGTAPYTYAWSDGGVTTQNRTGLAAGTYTVTVTDANMATGTASIIITQPTAIVLSETHVNVLCNGASTGSIDLTVSGGTGAYTYSWTGGVTTQDRSGLVAGTYTVTVTDANACTKTLSVTITQSAAIVLTETHINVQCNGQSNGSIDLTATGGTGAYTYSWTGGVTTQDRSGLSAGTYTVTVTDANACTKTLSVTITQPTTLSLSETHVNVLCNGNSTGSIDLTVTGGVSPYTYSWTGGATTQDLSGLAIGTYTVTVTDANGCTKTISATITEPTALSLSTTQVDVQCNGNSTGSIDLTPTGGTPAYTYSWTGGATTQDRSGLAAGTYTVTVTDANGCTKTISATITEPATGISLSETHVNVLCNGNSTGSIDLTPSGGITPYTYSWTGGATTQDRLNLAAGTYTVTVTDVSGCTKTLSATITEPTNVVLTETHVNVLCNGNSTGSIDLSVSGGVSPYTYSWTGGATTQDRSGLAAGTYTVTVTDANACTKTLSATITEPTTIVLTETHVNVLCNGNSTGSIDLTVSGGVSPYTYSWTGGATTQDRSGLAAGTYTVTVTDANACTKTLSATITEPAAGITLTETHVNVLCNGNSTGSIDLTPTGGTTPYTYSWTGGATTQDRLNLAAGTYTVTVTDVNGCTKTLSAIITEPTNVVLTETHVNVLCNGNSTGSIDLTVSGGVSPYTYSWTGGATTQDRSGLAAGTYTVTVTDANACTKTLSATITEPTNIVLTETHVNVLCNGNSTGSIDLTVSGGVSPYTYSWTGGATTQDRSGLAAGTYTVTVTDANACTKTLSATITEPAAGIVLSETHVNVLCNGNSTGSIDLTPSGGTTPYTYSWTGGGTTQDRLNLAAGTYTVTVTDVNGCTKTLSATITEPTNIVLTETHVNVLCNGNSTGSIDLSVSGGVSPYTYSWTGGATTQDRSGLAAGTYTVTVTDANACTKTLSATITEPTNIVLTETHVNVLCNGNSTGSIDLTVSGGVSPYTYSWTGGVTTQDRSGLAAGTYTVTVTDANACTKTLSVTITEPAAGIVLTETHVNVLCNGNSTGSIDLTVSGGVSPYTYSWTGGATTQDRSGLAAGTYTVTVTDVNGCTKTLSATITEPTNLVLSETHVNVLCNGNSTGSIDLTVAGGVSPYTYSWTGGATTQDRSSLAAGTYTVTVTDVNACTKTLSATITEPTLVVLSATKVNVLCNGNSTGSIDLTVSGGTGSYTYSWTGGATTQDRSGLAAGTYTVTVTDVNACTKTLSVTITEPTAIVLTETHVNVLCNGNSTGSIDLTVSGGVSPYTYSWTGGATTQDRSGLAAGTYTVTVTDANFCTKTLSATLTEPTNVVLTETHVNVLCNGSSTGSIDLTVSGGVSPYTYSWTGGATTQDRSGLAAGTYTVTVTDVNACTKTLSATITEPTLVVLSATQVNVLCNGNSTGSIDLTVSGGTGAYTYSWTGGVTTQDRSGLAAGTYTVTVTDANACTKTLSVTITQPTVIVLTETHVNVLCNGASTGSIDLTVSGGVSPYTYSWTGGATTQDRSGLGFGTYTVTVTDVNACTKTLSVTITETSPLVLTETHVNVLCNGNSTGSIDLTVSGGSSPYTYSWTGGVTTQDRSGLVAGTYTVTVTDANGCSKTTSVTITQPTVLALSTTQVNVLCFGGNTGSIDLTPSGGTPAYTYSWTGGVTTQDRPSLVAGTYTVTVTDANGCSKTISVTITQPTALALSSTVVHPTNCFVANGSIDLTLSGGTPGYTYDWSNDGAENPDNDPQDLLNMVEGTYTVTVTDANGCTATHSNTLDYIDIIPPVIICKAFIANLNALGNVSIVPSDVYQSGSDNCGVVNLVSVVASSFSCNNVGSNLVILTANDGNGNTSTCSATVTVRDVTPPVAKCQNVTANLGPNGTVTVPPAAVNNASTDNCSITFTLTPNTFNCAQIGMQTVTLTATDPGGNTATCTAKVTVKDNTGPTAKCKNPTIFLDNTGNATLSIAQMNNGSTDNCGISTMSIEYTQFNCSELAGSPWPVHLYLTDVNGNSSSCLGYVTVKDAIAPTAVCENVTVAIGPNGYAVVYSEDLALNSFDNCSVWSYFPVAKTYTKSNLGPNNLTITVKDWSGNASTCVSVVTVILPGNGDFQQGGGDDKGGIVGNFDLLVFPNPTSGEATMAFELPTEQAFSFRIFDTSGRMIYSQEDIGVEGENIMPLRMGELAPGIYLIDFQSENWKVQKRLVLQR